MKSTEIYWLETVVCSSRRGVGARLMRMLEARQEMKRRSPGCLKAWVSKSKDGQSLFLVQAIFENEEAWHLASKEILEKLDSRDGGVETLLSGPPLVGIFELPAKDLQ